MMPISASGSAVSRGATGRGHGGHANGHALSAARRAARLWTQDAATAPVDEPDEPDDPTSRTTLSRSRGRTSRTTRTSPDRTSPDDAGRRSRTT